MKKKRKLKRRNNWYSPSPSPSPSTRILPQILLASLASLPNHSAHTLLIKHVNHLRQSLHPSKTLTLITNNNLFLSLLPPLLRTPSVAQPTAEIVGAISLYSFEFNEMIARDPHIVNALLDAVLHPRRRVSMAACNALLDLCTTLVGREKLCQANAVPKLMSVLLQVAIFPPEAVSLCSMKKRNINSSLRRIMDDEFQLLVLDATVILINTCNAEQLTQVPHEPSGVILSYLKALFVQVQNQSSLKDVAKSSEKRNYCLRAKMQDLTESIFRLSINYSHSVTNHTSDKVKRGIFGPNQIDFENFMSNYWENSPILLRSLLGPLENSNDILSSFRQSFNSQGIHDVLSSILEGLVCCPPLPSDELDILNFLNETNDILGYPITYGQDIRVVKVVEGILGTLQGKLKQEVHFLNNSLGSSCISGSDLVNIDLQKCEEAYQGGYTIALRGMEFRSENIASIANELASLFGQPSVGANSYLTPPRSQGLARHYDDHCVFVCQLFGNKQWKVFPRSTLCLPRLYGGLDSAIGSEDDIIESRCKKFLLEEGDILYIPRGCPHEACTGELDDGREMDDTSTEFSFHLTLGIEVEPPFEWEGFAHVAVHCWNQNMKVPLHTLVSPFSGTMNDMSINLFHVAIQQIGAVDPTFAKACLVAAFSSSETQENQNDALLQSQRATFSYVVSRIDKDVNFLKALKSIEVAVEEKTDDMFHRMRWLRHLYPEKDTNKGHNWDSPLAEFESISLLFNEYREDAEATFMQVKSRFCREVIFEDVCESFGILLQKYKRVRTQYMNGMLSLHCNGNI